MRAIQKALGFLARAFRRRASGPPAPPAESDPPTPEDASGGVGALASEVAERDQPLPPSASAQAAALESELAAICEQIAKGHGLGPVAELRQRAAALRRKLSDLRASVARVDRQLEREARLLGVSSTASPRGSHRLPAADRLLADDDEFEVVDPADEPDD